MTEEGQIFDLTSDIGETNNVASKHPYMVKKMNEIFVTERTDNVYFPYGGISSDKVE
ncbi:MAG: hypothetical protein JXR07_04250 [Reichenbachiella sp.]